MKAQQINIVYVTGSLVDGKENPLEAKTVWLFPFEAKDKDPVIILGAGQPCSKTDTKGHFSIEVDLNSDFMKRNKDKEFGIGFSSATVEKGEFSTPLSNPFAPKLFKREEIFINISFKENGKSDGKPIDLGVITVK